MQTFRTHTGEIVTGERLTHAFNEVANDWAQLAKDIRAENAYASHVTEDVKENSMLRMLDDAEKIRGGEIDSFTIWQRINNVLTGECVAFLPK